jgi:hypothetical protein
LADGTTIATAAITGGTAVVSGCLGYLGARLQPQAEMRRAELEQVEAVREQRRRLYADYMQKLLGLSRSINASHIISPEDFNSWRHDVFESSTLVTLFGEGAVASAVREQIQMVEQFCEAVEPATQVTLFSERVRRAWLELEPRWLECNRAVIKAMRTDVEAPGTWTPAKGQRLTGSPVQQ